MQLQTTSPERKFPNEYSDAIFIQIDQHLKKLLQKYKGVPILWNTVYYCYYNYDCNDDCHRRHHYFWLLFNRLPHAGSGIVRIDLLHFPARCHKGRLKQTVYL